MTTPIPMPTEKIVAPHGGPNQTWWQYFSDLGTRTASSETGIAGLGTAAAKNVGTSGDTVPLCNTVNAWSKQQYFPIATLSEADALAGWDLDTKQVARLTMTSSFTLANPTNAKPGATYQLAVIAGANVLGFGSAYLFPANGAVPTTVGKSLFSFLCVATDELWCVGVKEFA